MKLVNFYKKSLSNQVLSLVGISFISLIIGTSALFFYQDKIYNDYIQQRTSIDEQREVINDIYDYFNSEVLFVDDSIAFKVPEGKKQTLDAESELQNRIADLEKLMKTKEERAFYQEIDQFTTYYFHQVLPLVVQKYEQEKDPSVDLDNDDITIQVERFLKHSESYSEGLQEKLKAHFKQLTTQQLVVQYTIVSFLILLLIILITLLRIFFKKIGKPLAEFTFSANEIVAGRDAILTVDPSRKDELGTLAIAFEKMIKSVQEKEQDLVAHNEELIAQQEELQAQQEELQSLLVNISENKQKLLLRNKLINSISTSLNKDEVLHSIVRSMCNITRSEKGIIAILEDKAIASYGISNAGIKQFVDNLDSGLVVRLITDKKPFTVMREQPSKEKGYHETVNYSYDIYLPIISSNHEVEAIMVFTRFGDSFSQNELEEYETLARQITIYLAKISMFEQSEKERRINQDILNTVQEGIQLLDKDRNIVQVNSPLTQLFNWGDSTKEILGLSWQEWSGMMADQIQEREFLALLEDILKKAIVQPNGEHTFIYLIKNSNQVVKVYCKAINDSQGNIGTLLVHRDITKEYEIAQMKSEFVSTVSHELRTPLASVLGFTELLLTKEIKPERKTKYLHTIYNEAKRLTALINDFLDIQRMESGKQMYEKKFIDIVTILQNVVELQKVNTDLHRIELLVENEETMILGDKFRLEQVCTNLISNAIKYSPNGGTILIRVYSKNGMVAVDVKDEGLGIPEEEIPKLFQPFYRVDNSDRRRIGGTGLGLSIVEEIIKAHDGVVSVKSEYGKGSTFTVQFPMVTMIEKGFRQDVEKDPASKYSVMIIEDDLNLAELLTRELQDNGFQVSYFNSGQKALEQMKKVAPNVVVLDIMLDDKVDGWTIMKEMKDSKQLKDVPIFVSSALEEKERGFSLGAHDYLIKPYKPSQLSKLITQTLLNNEKSGHIMVPQKKET